MIVFSFMQEDSREGENYLVTNIFENYEDLLDKWLDDFASWDLKEYDYEEEEWVPMDRDRVKEVIMYGDPGYVFYAHNEQVFYTFSTIDTDRFDQEYFKEQRDMVAEFKIRRNRYGISETE